jgi:hypothetical protein
MNDLIYDGVVNHEEDKRIIRAIQIQGNLKIRTPVAKRNSWNQNKIGYRDYEIGRKRLIRMRK